jgi:nitrite reductase (NAD(P)H)
VEDVYPWFNRSSTLKMTAAGNKITNSLCPHFTYSRADLYNIIRVKQLKSLTEVMKEAGISPDSLGCEVCKPSSLWNHHMLDPPLHGLQDTNDRYLANLQRNGTFSVIPRIPNGEITPDKLAIIAKIAKKYNLYTNSIKYSHVGV